VDPKKGGCGFYGFNSRLPISSIDPPTTLENGLKPWPPVWVTASEKHILTLFEDTFGAGIDYAQLVKSTAQNSYRANRDTVQRNVLAPIP
jgi:hypothetical protein